MRLRIFALVLVCAANLCAQHHFSWQEACFKNPAAPYCSGHEFAVRPPAAKRDTASRSVVTNPFSSTPRSAAPSLIELGGIDWRFADPAADALIGFDVSKLSASPLARKVIARLGASQGLTDADMEKIFGRLSGVDQAALSVRGNRIVLLVTGPVMDSTLPAPQPDFKVIPISGSAMLIGHADAVDDAYRSMAMTGPPAELARLAEELQDNSDFWAVGSAGILGPQAVTTGVQRFSLRLSTRDGLTGDLALEFNGVPSPNTLRTWQTTTGVATLEGNVLHIRVSMDAEGVQQAFAQIAASPAVQRLAALLKAAQSLPVRDNAARRAKPVIYGLDNEQP